MTITKMRHVTHLNNIQTDSCFKHNREKKATNTIMIHLREKKEREKKINTNTI